MVTEQNAENQVTVERDVVEQILSDVYKIASASSRIGDAVLAMTAPKPEPIGPAAVPDVVEPRVWALDEVSLREYDAEQLVALRADHRGDNHEPAGCQVCNELTRRLGSL